MIIEFGFQRNDRGCTDGNEELDWQCTQLMKVVSSDMEGDGRCKAKVDCGRAEEKG